MRSDSSATSTRQMDSARALDSMWHRYVTMSGLMLRIMECTLVPPWLWLNTSFGMRLVNEEKCLNHELRASSAPPPASFLRWDLPDAVFRGGRWLTPSQRERNDQPGRAGDVCGCWGHQISSTSIGMILKTAAYERVQGAFPHDASTTLLAERQPCSALNLSASQMSAAQYARVRKELLKNPHPMAGHAGSPAVRCKQKSLEMMAHRHRAYARLRGVENEPNRNQPQCLGLNAFYNQVHSSYHGPADIAAIFYVNDTHTPSTLPEATDAERDELVAEAKCAAARAYGLALKAAKMAAPLRHSGRAPAVLQYRFTPECFASHVYLNRSSQPPPRHRPSDWFLAEPPADVRSTCKPPTHEAPSLLLRAQQHPKAYSAAKRELRCKCMGDLTREQSARIYHSQTSRAAEDEAWYERVARHRHSDGGEGDIGERYAPADFLPIGNYMGVGQLFCGDHLCVKWRPPPPWSVRGSL